MFCITLASDGTECFREERPKRWIPRNGFQRGSDGNFYKRLDDPRCISFQEAKQKILEKQKKETNIYPIKNLLPSPPSDEPQMEFGLNNGYILNEILDNIDYKIMGIGGSGQNVYHKFEFAEIYLLLGIKEIDGIKKFAKIEVYPEKDLMYFWKERKFGKPDYIVKNIFQKEKHEVS